MSWAIDRILHPVCALALLIMMAVGAADIIMGEVFNKYLSFKVELSELLLAVIVFLAIPIVSARDDHIIVDIFYVKMGQRWKLFSDLFSRIVTIIICTMFAVAAWHSFTSSWAIDESALGLPSIPIYPIKFAVVLGFGLSAIINLARLIRILPTLRTLKSSD